MDVFMVKHKRYAKTQERKTLTEAFDNYIKDRIKEEK